MKCFLKLYALHLDVLQTYWFISFSGMTHAQLNTVYDLHQKWIGTDRNSENSVILGKLILTEYDEVLREMQDMLASSKSQYDLHAMSFGIFILIVVSSSSVLCTCSYIRYMYGCTETINI